MKIDEIVDKIKINGSVIAIKTDTVYGLVCNAYDEYACKKIYKIKKRDGNKPLAIFVKSIENVKNYIDNNELSDKVLSMLNRYWPGALTVVFNKKKGILDHLTCGSSTIGVRIPKDSQILDILEKVDFPLAETSCNISGEKDYKNASEIRKKLGDEVDLIVDDGEITDSLPSTVIRINDGEIKILRQGAIHIDE